MPIPSNTVKRVTLLLFDFRPVRDQNFQTVHPLVGCFYGHCGFPKVRSLRCKGETRIGSKRVVLAGFCMVLTKIGILDVRQVP